jgi:predicted dehydrogenase
MRIGFIGVGGIAGNYRASLKKLGVPIAAVCDINQARVETVAQEEGAVAYTDHRELLRQEQLDAVFIAIPPAAQQEQTIDAASAGVAVFVTKPVTLSLDVARRTIAAIAEAGVINKVGYMARYADITERVRELVAGQTLTMGFGRFIARMGPGHPWWGKRAISGGQIIEQSTHVFDLLRYLMGEVTEVHAYGHQGGGDDIADFEDSTIVSLRFASGAIGSVTSALYTRAPDGFALELSGRDLYLRMALDLNLSGQIAGQKIDYVGEEAGYFRQVELFLEAVRQRDQSLVRCSYADGARSLALTLAAEHSLSTGRPEAVEAVGG